HPSNDSREPRRARDGVAHACLSRGAGKARSSTGAKRPKARIGDSLEALFVCRGRCIDRLDPAPARHASRAMIDMRIAMGLAGTRDERDDSVLAREVGLDLLRLVALGEKDSNAVDHLEQSLLGKVCHRAPSIPSTSAARRRTMLRSFAGSAGMNTR